MNHILPIHHIDSPPHETQIHSYEEDVHSIQSFRKKSEVCEMIQRSDHISFRDIQQHLFHHPVHSSTIAQCFLHPDHIFSSHMNISEMVSIVERDSSHDKGCSFISLEEKTEKEKHAWVHALRMGLEYTNSLRNQLPNFQHMMAGLFHHTSKEPTHIVLESLDHCISFETFLKTMDNRKEDIADLQSIIVQVWHSLVYAYQQKQYIHPHIHPRHIFLRPLPSCSTSKKYQYWKSPITFSGVKCHYIAMISQQTESDPRQWSYINEHANPFSDVFAFLIHTTVMIATKNKQAKHIMGYMKELLYRFLPDSEELFQKPETLYQEKKIHDTTTLYEWEAIQRNPSAYKDLRFGYLLCEYNWLLEKHIRLVPSHPKSSSHFYSDVVETWAHYVVKQDNVMEDEWISSMPLCLADTVSFEYTFTKLKEQFDRRHHHDSDTWLHHLCQHKDFLFQAMNEKRNHTLVPNMMIYSLSMLREAKETRKHRDSKQLTNELKDISKGGFPPVFTIQQGMLRNKEVFHEWRSYINSFMTICAQLHQSITHLIMLQTIGEWFSTPELNEKQFWKDITEYDEFAVWKLRTASMLQNVKDTLQPIVQHHVNKLRMLLFVLEDAKDATEMCATTEDQEMSESCSSAMWFMNVCKPTVETFLYSKQNTLLKMIALGDIESNT